MNAHDIVLIGSLVDRCPPLLPVLQEHLDDYDSLVSHVFMADVTRFVSQRYAADADDEAVACVLDVLEAAFKRGRHDDRELIGASFLENLPTEAAAPTGLRLALGPTLRGYITTNG